MCLIHSKDPAHKSHLFRNQSILIALHVFDSLKITGSQESFIVKPNFTGHIASVSLKKDRIIKRVRPIHSIIWAVLRCRFSSVAVLVNSSVGNTVRIF